MNMNRMSSIELALANEKIEVEFYEKEAARSRNRVARALFETLAGDEQEHIARIARLHRELTGAGSWPTDVPIEVKGTEVRKVLAGIARDKGSVADHDENDIAALKRAAGFEDKGASLYLELAKGSDNPMEARFFKFLAGIEREHFMSIKDSLLYLEDPQAWHEAREHSTLDG
ncbi:MAG: ferritin family protein [Deltaproteobacteria bacterium]|nr:ferritin family protein [Deltaproteobacteria bacterium]